MYLFTIAYSQCQTVGSTTSAAPLGRLVVIARLRRSIFGVHYELVTDLGHGSDGGQNLALMAMGF